MKTIPPEVDTAIGALFWALVRLDAAIKKLTKLDPFTDVGDQELQKMLMEHVREAFTVAFTAIEVAKKHGLGKSKDHAEVFDKFRDGLRLDKRHEEVACRSAAR